MKVLNPRIASLTALAVALSLSLKIAPALSQADVSVTKTASAAAIVEGATLTYTVTLANNGPDPATGVSVRDYILAGNTFVSVKVSQGTYVFDSSSRLLSANFGTLPAGSSATAVVDVVPVVIPEGRLFVTAPASVAGEFPAGLPNFGPVLTPVGLSGQVAMAAPALACTPLSNPADIAGKIALIDRGVCAFSLKVKQAQDAGAVGVIIASTSDTIVGMALGTTDVITIPSLLVGLSVGNSIKGALAEGVSATLAAPVPSTQQRANGASAASDGPDPVAANNTASVTVDILRDSDGDFAPDTTDECSADPLKANPGACGCGTPDLDVDGSGTVDCLYTNELASRVDAAIALVGQLKMAGGRIRNRAVMRARINALLADAGSYLAAHADMLVLTGPTVNPSLLLTNATTRTRAVFRANADTFRKARRAALKALTTLRAGLLPV